MATSMFGVIDGNREHLSRWFDWLSTTLHIEDSLQYLFDKEKETEQGKKIEYGLFVDNEYIGNISLFNIHQKNKSAEMGYWLSFSHMRNGYMTEAIQILEKKLLKYGDYTGFK